MKLSRKEAYPRETRISDGVVTPWCGLVEFNDGSPSYTLHGVIDIQVIV